MRLTQQQRDALNHDGNVLLVACPGSGKTQTILAKLLKSVDVVRNTPRRAACITYTNTAVHEIENRLRTYGSTGDEDYCDISTIHSFCQNNVLRHFYWRLPVFGNGYTVLPSDSEKFLEYVEEISEKYSIGTFERQQFESLNRKPSGEAIVPAGIPNGAAIEFWERLEKDGFIDFCNIVYWSYRLLSDHPSLARGVASRFAFILVDEFQDTSALQVEILRILARQGISQFWLVGDPEQSIYSFAGAERELMFSFAADIYSKEFPLSGNFRSSSHIVECAERLIARQPRMSAVGESATFDQPPRFEAPDDTFALITDHFLPWVEEQKVLLGDAAILAPSWYQLMPLGKKLREYGVPVVGPGARPYKKRSHVFAEVAEQVCAYIEGPDARFVRQVERAIYNLVLNLTGKADFRVFSFFGRRVVFQLLREGAELQARHEGAVGWLRDASQAFGSVLHREGLLSKEKSLRLPESAQAMIEEMSKNGVDTANLAVSDLGMFAVPDKSLKLLTLHSAKGREFSAVAIIALNDGWIPYHNTYNRLTAAGLAEARRLLYVGITRAERILMMSVQSSNWRQPCRFLGELGCTL